MTRFICTNCGYSLDDIRSCRSGLSCPGCRHRLETDGEQETEIQEHEQIFFEELMSGRTARHFDPDELIEQIEHESIPDRNVEDITAGPWRYRPRFAGSARGYFSIWIVNVLLSVITLGIFMVRGEKRTRKYFLNNIVIGNGSLVSLKGCDTIYDFMTRGRQKTVRVEKLSLESTAKALTVYWIRFSNILACICSLGLLIPWAKVRGIRYFTGNTAVVSDQKII